MSLNLISERLPRKDVGRALVEEMKKQKNAQGSVGHCLEDSLSGSTPKAEPRPKAATRGSSSELDAKSVFRFLRSAWEVSQRPSRFSAFSSLQLWGSFRHFFRVNQRGKDKGQRNKK